MMPQSPDYPALVNVGRIRKEVEAYFKGARQNDAANKQTWDDGQGQAIIEQIEAETARLEAMAQRMEAQNRR
jgi:hypothetical protein